MDGSGGARAPSDVEKRVWAMLQMLKWASISQAEQDLSGQDGADEEPL